jgi:hypothetical protein
MDHCDECGFVYGEHVRPSVASEISDLGPRFTAVLRSESAGTPGHDRLSRRPSADVWSPVEYSCHVRDVLIAQRERLFLALVENTPSFAPIYRDDRVLLARYGEEDPEHVAAEIAFAARMAAWAFDGLDPSAWDRTCIYNFPEPSERSLLWLAQHTLHEGRHHLRDIERILDADQSS